ncbi:hypothetical protein K0M31_002694 [Melipona bicolor]|uniref:Uncharacterized protein n=1 Tax=Melipona bicolor TaxID=60889 RepID=A0AA40FZQ3_9HYME|nr:hypothetical protein K0M31_002694 [Melipona bicolor]
MPYPINTKRHLLSLRRSSGDTVTPISTQTSANAVLSSRQRATYVTYIVPLGTVARERNTYVAPVGRHDSSSLPPSIERKRKDSKGETPWSLEADSPITIDHRTPSTTLKQPAPPPAPTPSTRYHHHPQRECTTFTVTRKLEPKRQERGQEEEPRRGRNRRTGGTMERWRRTMRARTGTDRARKRGRQRRETEEDGERKNGRTRDEKKRARRNRKT